MKHLALPLFVFSALATSSFAEQTAPTSEQVEFFENKIRPILAENCYQCHNSVDKKKGDIALDYRAALLEADIIVPGKPAESLLIKAIRHADDAEPMPSKSPKLANVIIKNFEDWIRMGAPDPRLQKPTKEELESQVDWPSVRDKRKEWWSFQPIKKTDPPAADDPEWNHSIIDQFIFAGLKGNGLEPQSAASPNTLVRRLHLILTGLPPKPEVVDAFLADPSDAAYEKLVDQLLASKHYGERWGRYWMDWFRYAESYGSEGDPSVPYATQYRDYVIRAINADVPYDQLIREHLAGDLLENPRVNQELGLNESAIGPAHLRMVPHGFGVTDAYDEQITFTDNQIDVVSKAILGVTVSCARCHNHKFDPISQEDFYKFYGIMISSRPAIVNVDSPELQELHKKEITTLKQDLRKQFGAHWLSQIDAAIAKLDKAELDKIPDTDPLGAWAKLKDAEAETITNQLQEMRKRHEESIAHNEKAKANATFYADLRHQASYDQWFKSGNGLDPKVSPAGSFALAGGGDLAITGIYPAGVYSHLISDKHNGFLNSVFHLANGERNSIRAIGSGSIARFTMRSYPLDHGGLHPAPGLKPEIGWVNLNKYDYWNGEKGYYQINTGADSTSNGEGGAERSWFGVFEVYAGNDSMRELGAPITSLPIELDAITDRQKLLDHYRSALITAVTTWAHGTPSDAQAQLINAFVRRDLLPNKIAELPANLKSAIQSYRELEAAIRKPARSVGVVDAEPWDQPLLDRGDYKKEKNPVERGFLEAFPSNPYHSGSGRHQLAGDILDEHNTLTPRVIANRLWHHTFGRGIVASTDNLGRLGKEPTHPQLLDYLATDLRDHGWSMKHTVKQLVMSRTFRSASTAPATSAQEDPANLYLAYFSPRRLDAEAILDTINFVAHNDIGDRAVHTRAKRNALNPFLTTFNYPIPTSTVGVRDLTDVPAQALTLMNGQITQTAAQQWSARLRKLETDTQRIQAIFKQAYARPATKDELTACLSYISGKADDDSAALSAKLTQLSNQLASLQKERDDLLAPVRAKLQAQIDTRNAATKPNQPQAIDLKPIGHWDFAKGSQDLIGNLHGTLKGQAKIADGALILNGGLMATAPLETRLRAKTLEVLVQLEPLTQSKGGAITVQTDDATVFDGIVYSERQAQTWMSGSDHFNRTTDFADAPREEEADKQPVRIVITYQADGTITAYRNGKPYGKSYKTEPVGFAPGRSHIVFGTRHGTTPDPTRSLTGKIFEARLYDRALSPEEVAAASSGSLVETLTHQMITAALLPEQAIKAQALDEHIAKLSAEADKLTSELNSYHSKSRTSGDPWFRLAHAILNSKELIYVY